MGFMKWSEKYSVGIAVYDEEHKKLVAMIDALYEGLSSGTAQATIGHVVDEMVEYAIIHFNHEEMYFDDCSYADAAEHRARHLDFKKITSDLREQMLHADENVLAIKMLGFLREWLESHIMVEDKAFCGRLLATGIRWRESEHLA